MTKLIFSPDKIQKDDHTHKKQVYLKKIKLVDLNRLIKIIPMLPKCTQNSDYLSFILHHMFVLDYEKIISFDK